MKALVMLATTMAPTRREAVVRDTLRTIAITQTLWVHSVKLLKILAKMA
eukprot:CAMPEP_0172716794 /NCGR_PEP_ID=MMETSP1074-20121228/69472_1 /TAXON_ID=2916 /ORGANISM="Ceratium fusus, Strain PA161109" /LENGTH=48 /DNA_ID= /DNA_START= /DNA_END= /DNA_ORIENTATION=